MFSNLDEYALANIALDGEAIWQFRGIIEMHGTALMVQVQRNHLDA